MQIDGVGVHETEQHEPACVILTLLDILTNFIIISPRIFVSNVLEYIINPIGLQKVYKLFWNCIQNQEITLTLQV